MDPSIPGHEADERALDDVDPLGLYVGQLGCYGYMMTTAECAEFLGQSRQAVSAYIRRGQILAVKAGSEYRVPKKSFVWYLYSRHCAGTPRSSAWQEGDVEDVRSQSQMR